MLREKQKTPVLKGRALLAVPPSLPATGGPLGSTSINVAWWITGHEADLPYCPLGSGGSSGRIFMTRCRRHFHLLPLAVLPDGSLLVSINACIWCTTNYKTMRQAVKGSIKGIELGNALLRRCVGKAQHAT